MRLGRMAIAGVLAAGLVAIAGPARANGAGGVPPRPGLKPLLLEPLVWEEACQPAHTRVELPVGRMSHRMRAAWGLPQTADPAHWSPGGLLLLGRAYETGEMGVPDPAEAARIYCLLLRHHGSRMGAFLLSRLHAKGAGVAFSPALADHYARVAVPVWSAAEYRDGLTGPELAAGEFPADGIIDQQLAEAEVWLTRNQALPERRLHQVIRRYSSGERSPVSSLLAESLYERLISRILAGTGGAAILVEYLRYEVEKMQVAPGIVPMNVAWLQMVAYEAAADRASPDAQAMLGHFFLSGTLFPQSDLLAFAWFHVAKNTGATVSVSLSNIRDRLSHREVQGVSRFLKLGLLPTFVFEDTHIQDFRALITR